MVKSGMAFKLHVMRIKNSRERLENPYLFASRAKVPYIKKKKTSLLFQVMN